ncbi:MAG TPA: MGMT family protein [Candidatus Sumerlaeota bacterium]|nr:MGMT family protein [Candidatus Sumerlaeota bacterium]HPK03999.1 MGMT family protein [Candidatus Sumerlaeota bacterium]
MKQQPVICCRALWHTPIGPMAGSASTRGIVELRFPPADQLVTPADLIGEVERIDYEEHAEGAPAAARAHLAALEDYLQAYFQGEEAPAPPLDETGLSEFTRRVWRAARAVPAGETTTYRELARRAGSPAACRAVGGVMAANRAVLLMPCHRVLPTGGRAEAPGQFGAGTAMKSRLLRHERRLRAISV